MSAPVLSRSRAPALPRSTSFARIMAIMGNAAFIRARKFLNYYPLAKWLALVGSVGTGVFFVLLLLVLALFADLMVERGEIPCFANLPVREQNSFANSLVLPENAEERKDFLKKIRQDMEDLGLDDPPLVKLAASESLDTLSVRDQELRKELLWYVKLVPWLKHDVSAEAAEEVRQGLRDHIENLGPEIALNHNLEDFGLLSLQARSQFSVKKSWLAPLARWSPWMWRYGNLHYLQGLLILAIVLAVVRAALMFLSSYMAARATIEAATRLRRAIYHHTFRLGTLAFRALGPSEAVGVSTRHLEAVHDALYLWLTVVFREPVKFGLLLVFAMLVNFWLALAFLLFALLVWLVGGQIAAFFRRQGRSASHRAADQVALLQESLMLMRLVKVYLMELFNQARVERQLAKYARSQLHRHRGEAIYRPLFLLLALLAALSLLLIAGIVVLQGQLGVTSAMVLVAALICLYWPLETWLEQRRFLRRGRRVCRGPVQLPRSPRRGRPGCRCRILARPLQATGV